jgi:peptidoglycan/LPS O-acetylase OafA/YrhL
MSKLETFQNKNPNPKNFVSIITKPIEFNFKSNSFDFLRLFLSLMVVFFHSFTYYFTANGNSFFYSPFIFFRFNSLAKEEYSDLGSIAVLFFFIISGFLIARSGFYTTEWTDFFKKRFWRIYPGYIVSLFFTCFLFAPIAIALQNKWSDISTISSEIWQFFIRNIFVETPITKIPTLTDSYFNGSYWTLLHEVRAYILVAFFGYLGWLKKRKIILFITILLHVIASIGLYYEPLRLFLDFHFYDFRFFVLFAYFLVGSCFFLYLEKIRWTWLSFILSVCVIIYGASFNTIGYVGPIFGTYIILFLSQVLPFRDLSKKIGDLSYGVYVYSSPIQHTLLFTAIGNPNNWLFYTIISILSSLAFGYFSWTYIEKPFLQKSKKISLASSNSN